MGTDSSPTRSETADHSTVSYVARASAAGRALVARVSTDRAILAFLLAVFILRIYLADANSYWNDEILSVFIYGAWNPNVLAAIERLAEGSIHPPFYQFILYGWMSLFGEGEAATRTLSNLAVTVSAYVLYRTISLLWRRSLAFVIGATYAVAAVPMLYALESRSYGLTMLMATVSMGVLITLMTELVRTQSWSLRGRWGHLVVILLANVGLIMTHYYNVFWLIAQALVVAVFLLVESPMRAWPRTLGVGAAAALAAPLAFLVFWGAEFFSKYGRAADSFQVEGPVASAAPWELFAAVVVRPNIVGIPFLGHAIAALIVLAAIICVVVLLRRATTRDQRAKAWQYLVLASWATLPLLITYLAFSVAGVERYSLRYFVYCVPPITALIALGLVLLLTKLWRRDAHSSEPGLATTALIGTLLLGLVLQPGFDAATQSKHDWRGNIARIVQVIEGAPEVDYFLVETGFEDSSRAIIYLEQFSGEVRSDFVFTLGEERDADFDRLLSSVPEDADRLLLMLNHLTAYRLPGLVDELDQRFERVHAQLDQNGRGYVVWDLPEAGIDR